MTALQSVAPNSWEWSPSSEEIAAWKVRMEDDGLGRDEWVWDLIVVDISSGRSTTVASEFVRGRWAPDHIRWTPDGGRLVTSAPPDGLHLDEAHEHADLYAIDRTTGAVKSLQARVPSTHSIASLGGRFDVGYLNATWLENLAPTWVSGQLTATEVGQDALKLDWPEARHSGGQVTYIVRRGGTVIASGLHTPGHQVRGLTAGTRYTFSVVAVDAVGNVSSALQRTVTTLPPDTVGPTPPTCADARTGVRYTDVDPRSVHGANILCSAGLGLVEGREDGSYDPGGSLTRAQTATILLRALERSGLNLTAERSFRDVSPDHPHGVAIRKLAAVGIINGVSEHRFDPSGRISRAQFASLLTRTAERYLTPYPSAANPFSDVSRADVHEPAIRRLAGAGVIQGTTPSTFEPSRDINRAQAASLFVRWIEDQASRMR